MGYYLPVPVLDLEMANAFDEIEENIKIDNFRKQYVNRLALTILAKFIKYTNIYNKKNHQFHICVKSLILFIFDRVLKLTVEQFHNIFSKTNPKLKRTFFENVFSINPRNSFFSIECSPDVQNKYILDETEEINTAYKSYFKVECIGADVFEYECSNYTVKYSDFISYDNVVYHKIPFSLIENPTVYVCNSSCVENDIFLIKLCNEEFLMIIPDSELLCFNFLLTACIPDVMSNGQLLTVKTLMIPLMTQIESHYFDVHNVIENIEEVKDFLFIDKNNSKKKCKTFEFQSHSSLNILQHERFNDNKNKKNERNDNLSINNPYLYLLLNNEYLIKSGGIFTPHIRFEKQLNNHQINILNERF